MQPVFDSRRSQTLPGPPGAVWEFDFFLLLFLLSVWVTMVGRGESALNNLVGWLPIEMACSYCLADGVVFCILRRRHDVRHGTSKGRVGRVAAEVSTDGQRLACQT
ncbi:hypothetical protein GE09DRAFT_1111239 [Coniochaeta sp. 2T2.1]|nr:hypothetical protein GE09DRAFT_1111239 [Coniochaeta sp. 2T2.1]